MRSARYLGRGFTRALSAAALMSLLVLPSATFESARAQSRRESAPAGATPASEPTRTPASSAGVPAASQLSALATVPFGVGETLQYSIAYAFLEAGTLRLAVESLESFAGRPAYRLTFTAQTNPSVSAIYSLKDNLQSWMDAERLHSLQFVKESVEKGKKRDRNYRLDQARHVRIDAETGKEEPMPADAQDDVSIFYFLRTLPLAEGKRFTLNNLMDPDDNPMRVSVLGSETVRVPAGTFDCLVLRLKVQTDSGIFSQGGELKVWMTKDARRLPIKIESKLAVGSFTASLTSQQSGTARTLAAGAPASTR
jgi:hypothetical protein